MKDVAIVSYCRTGIAKATRGALNQTHGIAMAAHVMKEAVSRAEIEAAEIAKRAVIGVCTAGGMATAALLER